MKTLFFKRKADARHAIKLFDPATVTAEANVSHRRSSGNANPGIPGLGTLPVPEAIQKAFIKPTPQPAPESEPAPPVPPVAARPAAPDKPEPEPVPVPEPQPVRPTRVEGTALNAPADPSGADDNRPITLGEARMMAREAYRRGRGETVRAEWASRHKEPFPEELASVFQTRESVWP